MIASRSQLIGLSYSLSLLMVFGLIGCADMVGDSTSSRQQGNRLYNEGAHAEAAGAFKNAMRTDPRDYKAHFGLAVSYDSMKAYQQAVAGYKSTLDVMTRTLGGRADLDFRAQVIDTLGSCIARSDQRDTEIATMVKLATESRKAEDWVILAKAYAYAGDADSALDAYNRAFLYQPKGFYVNKEYGLYLAKVGQADKAAAPLKRAYAINDKDEQVNAALSQMGIVPGLSLKEEKDLAQPLVPKGPLPEPSMPALWRTAPPANADAAAVQAPRD